MAEVEETDAGINNIREIRSSIRESTVMMCNDKTQILTQKLISKTQKGIKMTKTYSLKAKRSNQ